MHEVASEGLVGVTEIRYLWILSLCFFRLQAKEPLVKAFSVLVGALLGPPSGRPDGSSLITSASTSCSRGA